MCRLILVVLLAVPSCHSTPTSGGDATASSPAPSAAASSAGGPALAGGTLTLQGGGTLKLPEGATSAEVKAGKLPKESKRAHLFRLGSEKRLLMVNELGLEGGKSCKELLDEEAKRMSEAKADTDETRLKFRRMRVVEDTTIDNHRALYIEFEQQGLAMGAEERPKAAVASITLCREPDHAIITFASDQLTLPDGTRALLEGVFKSYSPPSKP